MIIDCCQLTCIYHVNCMVRFSHGTCLQGLYWALRCYVAFYIILVYNVVCCRYVLLWWHVEFYTTMVHEVVGILGYVL